MKLDNVVNLKTGMKFGYDVVETSAPHRRKSPSINRREDQLLDFGKRARIVETARDAQRNFSLIKWAVTKHLDYTTSFQLRVRTGNREFDRHVERAFSKWEASCDMSRRHQFKRIVRLNRLGQLVDGDSLILKVKNGRLQVYASDRIAKPGDIPSAMAEKVNSRGLVVDEYGAVKKYCLCARDEIGGLRFDMLADAEFCRFDGYFTSYDQTRGISPLASCLMQSEDLYEALNFNLIKAKLAALFGLKITRSPGNGPGFDYGGANGEGDESESTAARQKRYDIQARPGFVIEMDQGDDINLVASNTPSTEFQQFTELEVQLILAAIGMPYSLFDSSGSSYSSLRGDYQQYLTRVKEERTDVKATLYDLTDWVLPILAARGEIRMPKGMDADTLVNSYDWMPTGSMQLDPSKEVPTAAMAIQAGLSSYSRSCASLDGSDFYDIIDELAEERAYAKEKGVELPTIPLNIRSTIDSTNDQQPQGA